MSEVRAAFIGAGGNAGGHMTRFAEVEGARIVAVCDIDEARATEAAGKFGAVAYTDHHRMLDEVDCEVVYVSVPPFAHTDAEILAARKGCAVFVEKPVTLSMEQGFEILEAIEGNGVLSCVGFQLRLLDPVKRARTWLADKTVAMISSHRWGGLPGTPWWRVMSKSGGQLVEQTIHQVDAIRYLAGDVVEVYARYALRTMSDVEGFDIPDSQAVLMVMRSGALMTLTTSPMMTKGGGRSDIVFLLRDQILTVGFQGNSLAPGEDPWLCAPPEPTPNIDQVIVQAVRTGDQSLLPCSYREGLKTLDAVLAANRSAQSGKPERTLMD
jgi:predicted dehydrogenase